MGRIEKAKDGLKLTADEIRRMFADENIARRFPPVMTIDQAVELSGVPKSTIYDWSSRGLLKGCSRRVGRRLRILRDRFIKFLFN